jgi:hypothetical protein
MLRIYINVILVKVYWAPLARGIYLPLTDTPTIGNYNNPTQMAAGIYYQEGINYLSAA